MTKEEFIARCVDNDRANQQIVMAAIAGSLYLLMEKVRDGDGSTYLSVGIAILLISALAIQAKVNVAMGLLGAIINNSENQNTLSNLISRSNRLHRTYSGLMITGIAVLSFGVARAVNTIGVYLGPLILLVFIAAICISFFRSDK